MQYIYNTATLYISEYSVVCKNTHLTYISVTGNHMESDTRVSDFMRLYDFNLLDQLIYASHLEERETRGIRSLCQISLASVEGHSLRDLGCKKISRQRRRRNNEEPRLRNELLHDGRFAIRHDLSLRKFKSTLFLVFVCALCEVSRSLK